MPHTTAPPSPEHSATTLLSPPSHFGQLTPLPRCSVTWGLPRPVERLCTRSNVADRARGASAPRRARTRPRAFLFSQGPTITTASPGRAQDASGPQSAVRGVFSKMGRRVQQPLVLRRQGRQGPVSRTPPWSGASRSVLVRTGLSRRWRLGGRTETPWFPATQTGGAREERGSGRGGGWRGEGRCRDQRR